MLTNEQLQHFQTFGFVNLRQLFTPAEVETLREEFEAELDLVYGNQPFTGETRYWTMMLRSRTPFYASLLEDERFYSIAAQVYGDDVIGIGTDANRYVGDTRWHPDHRANPEEDCYGVKFAFYLDPVGATTGALRLVPGSHHRVLHEQIRNTWETLGLGVEDVPAYVCDSEPGDVVAFDMRCWHASHGGSAGRRMATCVYYNNPKGEVEETTVRKRAESSRKAPSQFGRPADSAHPLDWIENRGGSTRRGRWLERMSELGYFQLPA